MAICLQQLAATKTPGWHSKAPVAADGRHQGLKVKRKPATMGLLSAA